MSLQLTITKTRRVHEAWTEWEELKKKGIIKKMVFFTEPLVGKWQYILQSDKGKVSIEELRHYISLIGGGKDMFWEIYCLEGELFDDAERFDSLADAEKAARKYLC